MDISEYLDTCSDLRHQIADYDNKILELLETRIDLSKNLIKIKLSQNQNAYDPIVEDKKLETLCAQTAYPDLVKIIWPLIMLYCRASEGLNEN